MPFPITKRRSSATPKSTLAPNQFPFLQCWLRAGVGQFQDSAGTTPVTASGQSLGLWKDQSGQGNDLLQDQGATWLPAVTSSAAGLVYNGTSVNKFLYKTIAPGALSGITVHALCKIPAASVVNSPIMGFDLVAQNWITLDWTQGLAVAQVGNTGTKNGLGCPAYSDANWHLFSWVFNAGVSIIFVDGLPTRSSTLTPTTITPVNYTLGSINTALTSVAGSFQGQFAEVIVYHVAQSNTQVAQIVAYMKKAYLSLYPKKGRLFVFAGNSLTDGGGFFTSPTSCHPYQAMNGQTFWDTWYNLGVSGQTTLNMATQWLSLDPLIALGTTKKILVAWEGRNDVVVNSATANTAYNNLVAFCQARQNAGWIVVLMDVLPSASLTEATRTSLNNLLAADSLTAVGGLTNTYTGASYCARLIRLSLDTNIGGSGANTNTTYYRSDQIHLTPTGHGVVAGYETPCLAGL